ncbi:hypothetical protein [Aeromonas hydrophila]|nr:hypothetical protein [Aeromonas hydrophila]
MITTKNMLLTAIAAALFWSTASHAEEQRYLAIQHTDTVYANQGV